MMPQATDEAVRYYTSAELQLREDVPGAFVWAVCLVQVGRGVDFRLPVVGRWASQLTARVTSPRSSPPVQG